MFIIFNPEVALSSIIHKTWVDHYLELVKICPDHTRIFFLCGEQEGRYFILLMYGSLKALEKKTNSGNNLSNVENSNPVAQTLAIPTPFPLSIQLRTTSQQSALH